MLFDFVVTYVQVQYPKPIATPYISKHHIYDQMPMFIKSTQTTLNPICLNFISCLSDFKHSLITNFENLACS